MKVEENTSNGKRMTMFFKGDQIACRMLEGKTETQQGKHETWLNHMGDTQMVCGCVECLQNTQWGTWEGYGSQMTYLTC